MLDAGILYLDTLVFEMHVVFMMELMNISGKSIRGLQPPQNEHDFLINVRNLVKRFPVDRRGLISKRPEIHAVDGVSFFIRKGETLGLVGESGCGKTTIGRLILRLLEPTAGEILFEGQPILKLTRKKFRPMRRDMQVIFQDPFGSLNPRKTVAGIIAEPMHIQRLSTRRERRERVFELLQCVGLDPDHAQRYPHEFSGGQRQRIGIARALALNPKFVICDEPVSALDVSIQAQVLNLLKDLQEQLGLTYLFISHDLSVVKHMSERIAVMYLGIIVELSGKREIYERPLHPYTEALISAMPDIEGGESKKRIILTGDIPSPMQIPAGCRFHTRCRYATEMCRKEVPLFRDVGGGHSVACHLHTNA